jgi:RhtB (resistance to homoserine/threonine) family protein
MSFIYLAATVALVHLLAAASPGPDFFLAVRNSLMFNRRTGVFTAVGFALGNLVHISYCFLGIAVLLQHHPEIAQWVKIAGALYLAWLAYKSWTSQASVDNESSFHRNNQLTDWAALRSGFFTNVLNVKCSLYFLGLFTTLISPNTAAWQVSILCAIMVLITIVWFSVVAVIFTNGHIRKLYLKRQIWINRILAVLLIVLAIKVLF